MAALARATALAAPVVAPRGVARRSTGARVPSMASRVPSANLAASLRSVGGKQVRIARQNRARGVPAKPDPSKPSTTGVLFQPADGRAVRRRDVTRPARSIYERPRRRRSSLMTRSRASGIVSDRALALAARARLPAAGEAHVICPVHAAAATSRPSRRSLLVSFPETPIIAHRDNNPHFFTVRRPCPPSWA